MKNRVFSYVSFSHKHVKSIMTRVSSYGISNTELHGFEDIEKIVKTYGTNEELDCVEEIKSHIKKDFNSDNNYNICEKSGQILFFDTKGIHRGGIVSQKKRELIRIHCSEPEWTKGNSTIKLFYRKPRAALRFKYYRWG